MIEMIRIGEMADGDPVTFQRFLDVLHWRQTVGELRILGVTDGVATVEVLDRNLFLVNAETGRAH